MGYLYKFTKEDVDKWGNPYGTQWKWDGQTGTRVRPTGYDAPELYTYAGQAAKEKLSRLILGEQVELRSAYKVDRGRLVCDVYYKGRYLADYFPEYQ